MDTTINQLTIDNSNASFSGSVSAIASKSVMHRLLIAACLSDSESEVICSTNSKDIEATINCLTGMGAKIVKEGISYHITPIKKVTSLARIDCGESGSTLRFILPLIAILGRGAEITMHGRLPDRPLSPLYEEMQRHGAVLSLQGTNPFLVKGQMAGGIYEIAGNVSSQYITGLLFSLPLSDTASEIRIIGKLESRPYVNITLQVLRTYGIEIIEEDYSEDDRVTVCFKIKGSQTYKAVKKITVEGDWSNAAFFLSLGAITENGITTRNLNLDSLQGDMKITTLLRDFGADLIYSSNENGLKDITVTGAKLKGIDIDASDIPDLVPILAAVAAVSEGTTRISNIERLRIKESDRVLSVIDTLTKLGADIREEDRMIIIEGKTSLKGGTIDSVNDHRIAMMAGIMSARCEGPVTIIQPAAVNKSYPYFFEDLAGLTK